MKESPEEPPSRKKTSVANLVRNTASGMYFACVRVCGKLIRQSLKTDDFSIAPLRLSDLVRNRAAFRKSSLMHGVSDAFKNQIGRAHV